MFSDNDNPTSAAAAPAHEPEKDQASENQAHTEASVNAAAQEATSVPVAQADGDPRPEQATTPAAEAAHAGEATQHLDPEAAADGGLTVERARSPGCADATGQGHGHRGVHSDACLS